MTTKHEDETVADAAVTSAEARALDARIEVVRVETGGKIDLLTREVQALGSRVGENRRKNDAAQKRNDQRLDQLEADLRLLKTVPQKLDETIAAITSHAADDRAALASHDAELKVIRERQAEIRDELTQNTAVCTTMRQELQPVITAFSYGRKTWSIATWMSDAAQLVVRRAWTFAISLVGLVTIGLWLMGRLPLERVIGLIVK